MLRFHVPDMTCGGCARSIAKALQKVDAQARIEADPARHELRVDSAAAEAEILAALARAGFPAQPLVAG